MIKLKCETQSLCSIEEKNARAKIIEEKKKRMSSCVRGFFEKSEGLRLTIVQKRVDLESTSKKLGSCKSNHSMEHFKYEWLLNGAPLIKAHRYALSQDFGYIALNILYCFPEDSGDYTLVGFIRLSWRVGDRE